MPMITFSEDGGSFEVAEGSSMLDCCDQNPTPVPFGCTKGVCGTCVISVGEGAENLSAVTDQERDTLARAGASEGQRLACMVKVNGNVTVL